MATFWDDFLADEYTELSDEFGETVKYVSAKKPVASVTAIVDQNAHQNVVVFDDGETVAGEALFIVKRTDVPTPEVDADCIEFDSIVYGVRKEVFRTPTHFGLMCTARERRSAASRPSVYIDHGE